MARSAHPRLKFLAPGWFAVVLGWGGLALAWHQATALLGEPAAMISQVLGWAAIGALGLLALLTGLRLQRHASDWLADVRHPVRHPVLALVPMAMLVIAGFAVQVQDGMVYLDATELDTKATDLARPIAGPARRSAPTS